MSMRDHTFFRVSMLLGGCGQVGEGNGQVGAHYLEVGGSIQGVPIVNNRFLSLAAILIDDSNVAVSLSIGWLYLDGSSVKLESLLKLQHHFSVEPVD